MNPIKWTALLLSLLLVSVMPALSRPCGCDCCKEDVSAQFPDTCCSMAECIPVCDETERVSDTEPCNCILTCPQTYPDQHPLCAATSTNLRQGELHFPILDAALYGNEDVPPLCSKPLLHGTAYYNASVQVRFCCFLC